MIFVHSSTVVVILCQLPATSNPKTVGGMCYGILDVMGLNIPSEYKIINNHQSQPSLQQTPFGKHLPETANHRLGKPDTLSQHASVKPDKLSKQAKCRQAIPACIVKGAIYEGLLEPRTVDKQWTNGIAGESEEPNYKKISRANTTI